MDATLIKKIAGDAVANETRITLCEKHEFDSLPEVLGYAVCNRCGGRMRGSRILTYMRGYVAAGGAETDIVLDYKNDASTRKHV